MGWLEKSRKKQMTAQCSAADPLNNSEVERDSLTAEIMTTRICGDILRNILKCFCKENKTDIDSLNDIIVFGQREDFAFFILLNSLKKIQT